MIENIGSALSSLFYVGIKIDDRIRANDPF